MWWFLGSWRYNEKTSSCSKYVFLWPNRILISKTIYILTKWYMNNVHNTSLVLIKRTKKDKCSALLTIYCMVHYLSSNLTIKNNKLYYWFVIITTKSWNDQNLSIAFVENRDINEVMLTTWTLFYYVIILYRYRR